MTRAKRLNMMMGVTLATSLFLTACSSESPEETSVEKEIIRPAKLLTIQSTDAINIRRFPAELQASEETDIAFRVGGQLNTLNVVAGQKVKKGDLLASLDTTDFKLEVELAEANQRLAEAQFKRIQTMLKQNATTKSQYDSTKATLDQANNALQSARNQLKYTKVYAPFNGVISNVDTENFQYVSAAQTLMHMQDIENLDVDFEVPESLVVSIKSTHSDYRPRVIVDVAPTEVFHAAYKEHNTSPNATTMAYEVTMHLIRNDENQHTLLPGMTANVDIDVSILLGKKRHITVPVEAVLRHENTQTGEANSTVWVFNSDSHKVEAREVTLGALEGNQVEIIEGLSAGERVVAAGVHSLTDGMEVRPWTRERGL
ncbi:efflux RND transporter periplasmic adaptor subunit [Marinomonas rhizomae]|uniref:RND family efflux transporter MFP subunit n=1 Tax=Marinomonas rhizomae TaxID=491948 RepID=A0A366JAD9_9GAMM|nr:efflux RND transporter periplasmic adaptor subunit [Marinomonas rhizomae]RBP83215.1 RND family efflux transporter MFP subunit [Marinomonas rhizomae]RNF72488.1 efflux RND transporter periplasmic adaptor subunit [Marinomonas rhizomae]